MLTQLKKTTTLVCLVAQGITLSQAFAEPLPVPSSVQNMEQMISDYKKKMTDAESKDQGKDQGKKVEDKKAKIESTQVQPAMNNGHRAGNGDGDAKTAYDEKQAEELEVEYSLASIQLTAEEVRKRNKALEPLYSYYQEAKLVKFKHYMESEYGMNIYHYKSSYNDFYKPHMKNKEGVMDVAVRYYTDAGVQGTAFEKLSPVIQPKHPGVTFGSGIGGYARSGDGVRMVRMTNDDKFDEQEYGCRFALCSYEQHKRRRGGLFDRYNTYEAVYSSLDNLMLEVFVTRYFMDALKEMNIKALDATVVFTGLNVLNIANYSDGKTYSQNVEVIYPDFSTIAPIPQPIMFIDMDATQDEIKAALMEHVPRIHAYNILFDQQVMPSIADMANALKPYPDFIQDVKDAIAASNEHNDNVLKNDFLYWREVRSAFLMLVFGVENKSINWKRLENGPIRFADIIRDEKMRKIFLKNLRHDFKYKN